MTFATMAAVVFMGMSVLFGDLSSTTTSVGTEDDLGLGMTGWLEVGRHRDGWHVGDFHFGAMLLEIFAAVVLTWILLKILSISKDVAQNRVMNKHTFFLGAVLLALIALITHSVARGFLTDAMHRKAARIEQAQKQQTAYRPDLQALQSSRNYNILTTVGVVLTALSLVCMVTALMRREQGWYLILILLLFFDLVVPMLL